MKEYEATEQAYKNGYAKGYADAKAEFEKLRADEIREIAERWEKDDWHRWSYSCGRSTLLDALSRIGWYRAFVRNHEWDDIPESIQDHLEKWEEFLVENL